jgi:predicted DNA-binding WGR domain protein
MAHQAYVTLLYQPSAEASERFFEVRRCGCQVWIAEGEIHTFGESELIECSNAGDAENVAARLVTMKSSQGFALTRSTNYDADEFDYGGFTDEVIRGLEAFWRKLMAHHPAPAIDRLAIGSDSGAMTLSSHAHVSAADDDEETLFTPQEWTYGETSELEIAYRLLLAKHRDIPFEKVPTRHRDNILECMIRALEQLRAKPLFGNDVMLWVDIGDSGPIAGMFRRLNTKAQASELKRFYEGDAGWKLKVSI